MFAALKRCHWLLRVVLATLLAAALVPTLSRALAHWRGSTTPWSEVCTTAAAAPEARADMAMAGADGGEATLTHLLEHCPLCSLQTDLPALLPAGSQATPLLVLANGSPTLYFQAPLTAHAWAPAQARAPPLGS